MNSNQFDPFNLQPLSLENFTAEMEPVRDYRAADYTYEIIMEQIKEFEDNLDDNHEAMLRLTSFGTSILMAVTEIGYANPSTLLFYGLVDGKDATLIQHVSQLNFLLLAAEKPDPNAAPRRIAIGFVPPSEEE